MVIGRAGEEVEEEVEDKYKAQAKAKVQAPAAAEADGICRGSSTKSRGQQSRRVAPIAITL